MMNTNNEEEPLKYGEAYTIVKMGMKMINGEWVVKQVPKHLPRMSKKQASQYYSEKFNRYWKHNKFYKKNGVGA